MRTCQEILQEVLDSIEGGGRTVTFMDDDIEELKEVLSQQNSNEVASLEQDELESFKQWAEVEYNVNPNTEELNLSHIEVNASLKGWQARATRPAPNVSKANTPEQQPVAWLPYLADAADGVTGHYAIARKNPAGYREVWNLRCHQWAAFSDEVLTKDEALAILKKLEMPTAPVTQTYPPAGAEWAGS